MNKKTILIGFLGASTILPMNILMSCNQNQTEKFEEHWTRYTIYEGYNFVPTTNFVLERRIHSIYFVMEVVASNGKIYNYYNFVLNGSEKFEEGFIRFIKNV